MTDTGTHSRQDRGGGAAGAPVVELRGVEKTYRQGALDVPALRGLFVRGRQPLGRRIGAGRPRHAWRLDTTP